MLRSHVAEPLLDVVRRVIDTSGVDIELSSAVGPAAAARRDNLDLFVKAVAEFQAVDGDVSLPALLAYLTAEDDQGNGLDVATPTEADSVKLLTVHRSKGLEWHSVFLVGVGETRFPSTRGRTLWTSSPSVMPAPLRGDARDLPQLAGLRQGRARRLPRPPPAPRGHRGAAAGLRRVHPCRARDVGDVVPVDAREPAVRALGLPGDDPRPARGLGRGGRRVARQAGQGRRPPLRRRRPVAAVAADRHRPRGRLRPTRPRPSGRSTSTPPTRGSTSSPPARSPSGTPPSSGCSPRPAPTGAARSGSSCRPACRRPP